MAITILDAAVNPVYAFNNGFSVLSDEVSEESAASTSCVELSPEDEEAIMQEKWESGPYKEYNIEGAQISFLHRADSVVFGMSYKSALVVQTLKKVGRENTDDHIINKLRMVLTDEEIKMLEEDGRQSLPWIYSVIKQIASRGKNNV